MTKQQEALKLALEALNEIARHATTPWEDEWCGELANKTLTTINALAQPAPVQEFGLTWERFNGLEDEITTLQTDWQSALKEIERLKATQP